MALLRNAHHQNSARQGWHAVPVIWRAFARLSDRCKTLLRLLLSDHEPSYEEVGAALGMPMGAIGPTRMRCLDTLRRTLDLQELSR